MAAVKPRSPRSPRSPRRASEGYTGEPRGCYRPEEFQVRYGIGKTKFFALVKDGRIVARKLDGAILVRHEDAEAWARALPVINRAAK